MSQQKNHFLSHQCQTDLGRSFKVEADLFELNNHQYLIVIDYFSRYPEAIRLGSTSSTSIINSLKFIVSRHKIPSQLISDNGSQFSSFEFKQFTSSYSFHHVFSSPRYPQSNGLVERGVGTVKRLLQNSHDPQIACLAFEQHLYCGAHFELIFGQKIKTPH